MTSSEAARLELGQLLKARGYQFTTITPESHHHVLGRARAPASVSDERTLRDLFGWSRAVPAENIPTDIFKLLEKSEVAIEANSLVKSSVRFSTLDDLIFMHSSYPTTDLSSVFFGPDSYRFVRFLKERVKRAERIVDIGCGAGVGGISLATFLIKAGRPPREIFLTDVDDQALRFTTINAELNKINLSTVIKSDLFHSVPRGADLVIANPPFIMDGQKRTYRDGGANYGSEITHKIIDGALNYEAKRILVYTGACIVNGEDQVLFGLRSRLGSRSFSYEELDPDIFGEELSTDAYLAVDRIAAVGIDIVNDASAPQ